MGMPKRWVLPTTMSAPISPGDFSSPSATSTPVARTTAAGVRAAPAAGAVVAGAPITQLDVELANWLHAHANDSPVLRSFLMGITHLHSTPGMLTLTALAGWWFYRRGARHWIPTLLAAVPGGVTVAFWGSEDLSGDLGTISTVDEKGDLLDVFRVARSLFLMEARHANLPAIGRIDAEQLFACLTRDGFDIGDVGDAEESVKQWQWANVHQLHC